MRTALGGAGAHANRVVPGSKARGVPLYAYIAGNFRLLNNS
jgi:hypothetical protein